MQANRGSPARTLYGDGRRCYIAVNNTVSTIKSSTETRVK